MNYLITPDCICGGKGSLPADPSGHSLMRIPCWKCVKRYEDAQPKVERVDPLAQVTAERDALRSAVRDVYDAEHELAALRVKAQESLGSVYHHDEVRAEDRRDHLTADLYRLAGVCDPPGMGTVAYMKKLMREYIEAFDAEAEADAKAQEPLATRRDIARAEEALDRMRDLFAEMREAVK